MMAADQTKTPALVIILVSFCLLVSVRISSSSSQCVDGTYQHDGRDCCLCGVGLYVVEHCASSLQYGKCEPCKDGSYSSSPNGQKFCTLCTSCSHLNENLEEDEPCTSAKDRKCRCKKDHYCDSQTQNCVLCHPCKICGDEGIKVACAGNNNTVCNVKTEGGNDHVGMTVGIIFGILVIGSIIVVAVLWWKKRNRLQILAHQENGNAADVEMQPLRDVDIQRHLPEIAQVIGWKDMKRVAISSSIPNTTIDNCKMNHPEDFEEQTLELLQIWVESQGRDASQNLIQMLKRSGKKDKAQRVTSILLRGS